MEEVFRFVVVRPADTSSLPPPLDVTTQSPLQTAVTAALARGDRAAALRAASAYASSADFVESLGELRHGAELERWVAALRPFGETSRAAVDRATADVFGSGLAAATAGAEWARDWTRVVDTLLAASLVASRQRGRLGDVADAARAMYLLRSIGSAAEPTDDDVQRALTAPLTLPVLKVLRETPVRPPAQPPPPPPAPSARETRLDAVVTAARELVNVPTGQLRPLVPILVQPGGGDAPRRGGGSGVFGLDAGAIWGRMVGEAALGSISAGVDANVKRGMVLTAQANASLSAGTRTLLASLGFDPATQDVADIVARLDTERAALSVGGGSLVGATLFGGTLSSWWRNTPFVLWGPSVTGTFSDAKLPVPTTHGTLRPSGVGDLLIVRQQLVGYEAVDIAHVANVLEGEENVREHRRRETVEEVLEREEEETREEERDLESTDRNEMSREVQETLKEELEAEAGLKVSASYGPTVSIEVTGRVAYTSSREQSQRTAQEFAHQITEKTASKVAQRVRERRLRRVVREVEEFNRHQLTNTPGNGHIVGIYQWLTKIYEAQVFNYGQRTIYDMVVPEPAAFLRQVTDPSKRKSDAQPPPPFTIDASAIDATNYQQYAARYGAVGINPPPAPFTCVSSSMRIEPTESENKDRVDAKVLNVPEGYEAVGAHVGAVFVGSAGSDEIHIGVTIGRRLVTFQRASGVLSTDLDGETGTVPLGVTARAVPFATVTVEVVCRATTRATESWKNETHAAIQQAYVALQQTYEEKLAAEQTQTVIRGSNPADTQRLIRDELKRVCLTIVTQQHFDAFNGVEADPLGWPRPDLASIEAQGRYARFFEEAWEWENMTWVYYPYFWGRKSQWQSRVSFEDADPAYVDFIRAGAARVTLPVRPGFEIAIEHFMLTGEVWQGGDPPALADPDYISIAEEQRRRSGTAGDPVPVGSPWILELPTTLVRLRPDASLPRWVKDPATGEYVSADEG